MDLIALGSRHVLLPAWELVRGVHAGRLRHRLLRSQYLPIEQVRDNQWRDVQRMLRHVYDHNGFYRQRFDQLKITPNDIKSPTDFASFPVLTKDDLRNNLDSLISDEFNKSDLIWRRTGGSTGVPVQLYRDKKGETVKMALVKRHNEWARFLEGEKRAVLWGDTKEPRTMGERMYNALVARTFFLDTLKMDDQNMIAFADRIRQTGTRLLFGHGHSLFYLARFLRDRNIPDLKLRGIISSAEMLPPEERRLVEEVFGKVVFDRYGCEEIGLIASECGEHDGMHVAAEGVYVEIIGGTEREPGSVIVTDLINRATPLIRYEIGDLATLKEGACPCGRGLPRIGRVIGRTSDILYTPEGRRVSGISILDTMTIHISGLKQVQIVQDKLDELTLRVVKDANFSSETLKAIAEAITKYFGPNMKHQVMLVDKIALTGRGKFQFSICTLQPADSPSPESRGSAQN